MLARLSGEAQRFGEAVVPVGGDAPRPIATGPARKYKAEAGDTLAKIAMKNYGSSSKAYRDAILEANPTLQANPNLVIEGRTYAIPEIKAAGDAPGTPPIQTAWASQRPQQPRLPASSDSTYVVEEGDNLTRIATEQLGSPDGVAAIKELNRDLLKGGDLIRPGMKLKMPAKIASNN
jgi:nucleoid-associated protein YgaU